MDSNPIKRIMIFIGGHERAVLVALLLAAMGAWLFAELADEVLEGATATVDERLLLSLRSADDAADPLGPVWLEVTARDITGLGGFGILTLITLATLGFLVLQGKRNTAIYLLFVIVGGTIMSLLLKAGFGRPRPELVPHGQPVYTSSFPSTHSVMSAVTFLSIGALLAGTQSSRRMKAYLLGLAVLLTLLVGFSRVYLGVHWPTDVLAGWTAGAAWALLCWGLARRLRARGKIE